MEEVTIGKTFSLLYAFILGRCFIWLWSTKHLSRPCQFINL